jgi:SAM-dependent methyltransferase
MDWSIGRYERIAEQVRPAAEAVVEAAAPARGERVVDLGCGTGNAALLAAARGASTLGVDPAPRLLEVARERAAAAGLPATFAVGDAADIPVEDGAADAVLSVFGVIYCDEPPAAAAELARVTAPGGRIVLSAWPPGGALGEVARVGREAVAEAAGTPPGPPPFAWHEAEALEDLLGPHGFAPTLEGRHLAFTADSPAAYVARELEAHPLWVAIRSVLERAGRLDAVRERIVAILEAANEDPGGFRVTGPYVVATLRRAATTGGTSAPA